MYSEHPHGHKTSGNKYSSHPFAIVESNSCLILFLNIFLFDVTSLTNDVIKGSFDS